MNIKISINVDGNSENKKVFEFDNRFVIDETMQTILKDGFGFQQRIEYIYSMRNKQKILPTLTFEQGQIFTGDDLYVKLWNINWIVSVQC